MSFEHIASDFSLLAGRTSNLFLRTRLAMSGFLREFERGTAAAIWTVNSSELAIFKQV